MILCHYFSFPSGLNSYVATKPTDRNNDLVDSAHKKHGRQKMDTGLWLAILKENRQICQQNFPGIDICKDRHAIRELEIL